MRSSIAHKITIAQRMPSITVIARRLKAVEKLFMTICEKYFSLQE
jgi:hypothetical protein